MRSSKRKPSIAMQTVSCALAIGLDSQGQSHRQNFRKPRSTDFVRSQVGIIRDADIGQGVARVIEDAVAGGWVLVSRLTDRSQHGQPSALGQQWYGLALGPQQAVVG